MVWEGVKGVGSPVEEEVEGVGSPVWEEVEGVDPSVGVEVGSGLSSSTFSFNLFMYVSCDFLPRSCLLGFFVTFFDVLSTFILSKREKKLKEKMDPIFEHPVFDSAKENFQRAVEQLKKTTGNL